MWETRLGCIFKECDMFELYFYERSRGLMYHHYCISHHYWSSIEYENGWSSYICAFISSRSVFCLKNKKKCRSARNLYFSRVCLVYLPSIKLNISQYKALANSSYSAKKSNSLNSFESFRWVRIEESCLVLDGIQRQA